MTQQSRLGKYHDNICSIETVDPTASSDLRHALVMPWYENVADHLRRSSANRSSLVHLSSYHLIPAADPWVIGHGHRDRAEASPFRWAVPRQPATGEPYLA